jgi:hypothetical protein
VGDALPFLGSDRTVTSRPHAIVAPCAWHPSRSLTWQNEEDFMAQSSTTHRREPHVLPQTFEPDGPPPEDAAGDVGERGDLDAAEANDQTSTGGRAAREGRPFPASAAKVAGAYGREPRADAPDVSRADAETDAKRDRESQPPRRSSRRNTRTTL